MNGLRVGLVGAGGGVAAVHMAAYRTLDCIEVVAGSDVSAERLADFGRTWGVRTYSELSRMLEQESLDIACVCVPARHHREVAEQVASHGVHVLVEKPLAVVDFDELAQRLEAYKEMESQSLQKYLFECKAR